MMGILFPLIEFSVQMLSSICCMPSSKSITIAMGFSFSVVSANSEQLGIFTVLNLLLLRPIAS